MIVKGFKTLEGLEEKLREVPEEKRKVIVLVGRHPNEGTINIANRHHEDWEKHGAVVVRIPAEWTPHWLWVNAAKKKWSLKEIESKHSTIQTDEHLLNFFISHGFDVPVVNFHGTALNSAIAPHIGKKFWDMGYYVALRTSLFSHSSFEVPTFNRDFVQGRNHLAVEFFYPALGRGNYKPTDYVEQLLRKKPDRRFSWLSSIGMGMKPSSLGNPPMPKEAIERFRESHALIFEEVLAHLAKTGLKPVKR